MTNRYKSRFEQLLERANASADDAINIPDAEGEHITADHPARPTKVRRKPWISKKTLKDPIGVGLDAAGRGLSRGWKRVKKQAVSSYKLGTKADKQVAAGKSSARKATAAYRSRLGKAQGRVDQGNWNRAKSLAGMVTAPFRLIAEEELIEMGVQNIDTVNFDYYLIERKKDGFIKKTIKKAKKWVGKKSKEAGEAIGKAVDKAGKAATKDNKFDKKAKKRMTSKLSKEDKAKGKKAKKNLKESIRTIRKGAALTEALLEHSEYMATVGDGSPNMLELVNAAMNGEPATAQDLFKNAMAEKLAVALDAYREVASDDIFNSEPSDIDYDDYEDDLDLEDGEIVAEWTEDPEDEDEDEFEVEDIEPFEDDFEEDEDDSEED